MARTEARLFPALLRHFRTRRGMSQLDLAIAADVSARHVSFLETGRAQPSREMVLRLGGTLDVPLREQDGMLRAAGFEAEFGEPTALPPGVAGAIDRMLVQHEPFPMTVLDRRYDVTKTNQGAARMLGSLVAEPAAVGGRVNVFMILFDPRLVRPFILDWERVAHALTSRLHREVLARPDPDVAALLRSLFEYPGVPESWRQPDFAAPNEPTLTLRMKRGDLELAFLTTMTIFNAPQNALLEELRVESYYPLDDATARACERMRRG